MKFEWCFELEQEVKGCFDDNEETGLNDDDIFIVKGRELDDENNQYFQVKCKRTGKIYDAPASFLI